MDIVPAPAPPRAGPATPQPPQAADDRAMREAADAFEAAFLAEMLKGAGLGKPPEGFGGGAGEDQFASFLRQEQARAMVRAGGIGLSETIYQAMKAKTDD
ncbi:rod-binding protein [Frigidibacter sp. ROC022]|uniref:rod-binding protein n=1 Tax=Frigidibacter sp. ROC022 TaxID=2971796 RepID=UPI00215AFD98|nr:rod-binding protein [Frigidibacter sp. ROC022]MCR8724379.1 rod-binding protein [Frigidibacter sp. ROC022]